MDDQSPLWLQTKIPQKKTQTQSDRDSGVFWGEFWHSSKKKEKKKHLKKSIAKHTKKGVFWKMVFAKVTTCWGGKKRGSELAIFRQMSSWRSPERTKQQSPEKEKKKKIYFDWLKGSQIWLIVKYLWSPAHLLDHREEQTTNHLLLLLSSSSSDDGMKRTHIVRQRRRRTSQPTVSTLFPPIYYAANADGGNIWCLLRLVLLTRSCFKTCGGGSISFQRSFSLQRRRRRRRRRQLQLFSSPLALVLGW